MAGVLVVLSALTLSIEFAAGPARAADPGDSSVGGVYAFCRASWFRPSGNDSSVRVRCNVGGGTDEPTAVRISYWWGGSWWTNVDSTIAATDSFEVGSGQLDWVTRLIDFGSTNPFQSGTAPIDVKVGGVWQPAEVEAITATTPLTNPGVPEGWFTGFPPVPDGPTIPYEDLVMESDPEAYWRLSGGSATVGDDSSGNGNDATLTGGVTTGQSGALAADDSTAVALDGTSGYLEAPSSASLNSPTAAVTVELWAKPTSGGFGDQRPVLIKGYTSHTNPYYQYGIFFFDTGQYPKTVGFGFATGGSARYVDALNSGWVYGQWNHIVATYDGARARIYVNGILRSSTAVTGTLSTYSTATTIGAYANLAKTSGNLFTGGLDEVAIYDTALPFGVIEDHYLLGANGPRYVPSGLTCPDPATNNSLGAAELLEGPVVDRSLCDDESDWYELEVTAGDRVAADLFAEGAEDVDLALRDDTGDLIEEAETEDSSESIRYDATSTGSLFLEVYERGDTGAVYSLAASHGPPPACDGEDAFEPNDLRATATPLGATPVSGYVCVGPDVFVVEVPAVSSSLSLTLDIDGDAGDLDLAVYDDTGALLDASSSTGDTETATVVDPPEGDYFVEVYGYHGASNTYDLEAAIA